MGTGHWNPYFRGTHFYSAHIVTEVPDRSVTTLSVYPNPATEYVIFKTKEIPQSAQVELFDINGKKVSVQSLGGNSQIYVGDLPVGIYLYRLFYGGKTLTGKISKK